MSKNKKSKIEALSKSKEQPQIIAQHFSGPVPSPQILEQYRLLIPDAPERFMKMAEKNSSHLMDMDKGILKAEVTQTRIGQFLGLFINILFFIACMYALIHNQSWTAGVIAVAVLGGDAVIAFIGKYIGKKK